MGPVALNGQVPCLFYVDALRKTIPSNSISACYYWAMLNTVTADLLKVSAHQVGNKTNGDNLFLSSEPLDISDDTLNGLLRTFFLSGFKTPEFYTFTFSNDDHTMNPLFRYATQLFEEPDYFHKASEHLARHLFEISVHPQIKGGDLFVAYLSGVEVENERVDAIGIFKSENRQSFLKLDSARDTFALHYDDGISIDKLDKGCLIFNTNKDNGYKVCIVDRANKNEEAQYWKQDFLQLRPLADNFHHTREFLSIAKNYVSKQLTEDFTVSKADQIDLLNRSVDYFKKNDRFDKNEFEEQVFQNQQVIQSFRNFDNTYRQNFDVEIGEQFDISPDAVKKQSRLFKSVLKLDKNFHVYIHGNREMIEQGVDENGRKFYKLYYDNES